MFQKCYSYLKINPQNAGGLCIKRQCWSFLDGSFRHTVFIYTDAVHRAYLIQQKGKELQQFGAKQSLLSSCKHGPVKEKVKLIETLSTYV